MHHLLRRARVHGAQAVLQIEQFLLADQIGLADEDLVGETDLTLGFQPLVELVLGVLGIDQCDDGIEQVALGHLVVHEEGLRYRTGIGHAGGLDDDALEIDLALAALFGQILQRGTQVIADGAADAAVAHLDDLFLRVSHQDLVVDVLFAELVLDHGDFLAMRLGQHTLEQRGLAGAEEAGEDGGGNEGHGKPCLFGKREAGGNSTAGLPAQAAGTAPRGNKPLCSKMGACPASATCPCQLHAMRVPADLLPHGRRKPDGSRKHPATPSAMHGASQSSGLSPSRRWARGCAAS